MPGFAYKTMVLILLGSLFHRHGRDTLSLAGDRWCPVVSQHLCRSVVSLLIGGGGGGGDAGTATTENGARKKIFTELLSTVAQLLSSFLAESISESDHHLNGSRSWSVQLARRPGWWEQEAVQEQVRAPLEYQWEQELWTSIQTHGGFAI